METESFGAKVIHAVVFLAICFAIISIGWKEPLRYRFMSAQEIAEAEGRPRPGPLVPTVIPVTPIPVKGTRLTEPPRYKSGRSGTIDSRPHRKAEGLEPPPETPGAR